VKIFTNLSSFRKRRSRYPEPSNRNGAGRAHLATFIEGELAGFRLSASLRPE